MSLLAWRRGGLAGGPAVLLVHAWASDAAADWERTGWVDALAAHGFATYAPDLPGHGDSAGLAPPRDAEPAAWTARALLGDLGRLGVGEVAVVAFADGGMVAGHVAVRAPERVRRLVLVGADDRRGLPDGAATAAALRDARARVWDPDVADAVARVRADRRHAQVALADWVERAAWPAAPRLGPLRTPVLLAVATGDAEHHDRAPRLARLLHDGHLVSAAGSRREALASPELQRQVAAYLAEAASAE